MKKNWDRDCPNQGDEDTRIADGSIDDERFAMDWLTIVFCVVMAIALATIVCGIAALIWDRWSKR